MLEKLEQFYVSKQDPNKSCLLALRDLILLQHGNLSECIKYGMPCFCYGKKAICYLWTDKATNEPYVLFVEGKYLIHPDLEQGNRARMKIFRINATKDLPINTLQLLLQEAISLYR